MTDSHRQYTLKDIPAARLFEAALRGDLVVIHAKSGEREGPELRGYMMQKKNPDPEIINAVPDKPCFSIGVRAGGRLIPLNQAEDWWVYEVPPEELIRFRYLSTEMREQVRNYHKENLASSLKEAIDTVAGDQALHLTCIHCSYYFTPYTCVCKCGRMEAAERPEKEFCEDCGKELGEGAKAILSHHCDTCRNKESNRDQIARSLLRCNKCGEPLPEGCHIVCPACGGDTGPQINEKEEDDEMFGGLYGESVV